MNAVSRPWMCVAALLLAVTLCWSAPAKAQELTVSAAASLTNAFQELQPLYEAAHPGQTLTFNFAASGPLLRQIALGAPVDVFASADQKTMDQAEEQQLMDAATRANFAANALVLVVPADSGLGLRQATDLTGEQVRRIALGNPESVPAGRYAKAALTAAGLWEPLQPKLIQAETVRQVLDYVGRGEVDAGFVYMTDAQLAGDKVVVLETLTGHEPITYPVAVVATAAHKDAAQQFVNYLLGAEAQAVLARHGFSKP